jgi:hypothetical protein
MASVEVDLLEVCDIGIHSRSSLNGLGRAQYTPKRAQSVANLG